MAYRGTEAYDFSLFEPQVIAEPKITQHPNARPVKKGASVKKANAPKRAMPQTKIDEKKQMAFDFVDNYQLEVERKTKTEVVPQGLKKMMCFFAVCFALLVVLLALQSRGDSLMNEISAVQKEIKIEQGESVRLNAELSSKISSDKIDNYAKDVLGMVKAENYQISYIDLSHGDEIVVSGDKTLADKSELSGKIKALFAYIF